MALIPYGANPAETWPLDFAAARGRRDLEIHREAVAAARARAKAEPDEKKRSAIEQSATLLEQKAAALEADLAAYAPGSGPVFQIGHIPNALRAEIVGEAQEIDQAAGAERMRRDVAWSEKVVRWAVRGHDNLRGRGGTVIPFGSDPITWGGETRPSPDRRTLEAYQPFLADLALLAWQSQRLDEAGKNG